MLAPRLNGLAIALATLTLAVGHAVGGERTSLAMEGAWAIRWNLNEDSQRGNSSVIEAPTKRSFEILENSVRIKVIESFDTTPKYDVLCKEDETLTDFLSEHTSALIKCRMLKDGPRTFIYVRMRHEDIVNPMGNGRSFVEIMDINPSNSECSFVEREEHESTDGMSETWHIVKCNT